MAAPELGMRSVLPVDNGDIAAVFGAERHPAASARSVDGAEWSYLGIKRWAAQCQRCMQNSVCEMSMGYTSYCVCEGRCVG